MKIRFEHREILVVFGGVALWVWQKTRSSKYVASSYGEIHIAMVVGLL